jgi:hypothetical protein
VGEAFARLAGGRPGTAALVDLPGPEAVAFAAGAALAFEPVLLLDNWPHPHGVVRSHRTLAALAYYQPRFATAAAERAGFAPVFVLDRSRLSPYSEETNRFDNRYYARPPALDALANDGIRIFFYVVSSPSALPEPDDLAALAAGEPRVEVRALAVSEFESDPTAGHPERVDYGGSVRADAAFWSDYGAAPDGVSAAAKDHRFGPRPSAARPPVGQVAVIAAASGIILSAALDRRGSMNRFAGGWSG